MGRLRARKKVVVYSTRKGRYFVRARKPREGLTWDNVTVRYGWTGRLLVDIWA